jgi:hypothetical protein
VELINNEFTYARSLVQCLVQCFIVGSHSRCLRKREQPEEEMVGFFYEVKIIQTSIGLKKDGENEQITCFYGIQAILGWDPDRWWWVNRGQFLDYAAKDSRESTIIDRNPGSMRTVGKW